MTEVSDGMNSFLLTNAEGIRDEINASGIKTGDSFDAVVHVANSYAGLRGTIVEVSF